MNFSIRKASTADVNLIQELAHKSWQSAYQSFLSKTQIDFMLNDLYGTSQLKKEIRDGVNYQLIENNAKVLGFICSKPKKNANNIYRIEKLYILSAAQGIGIGRLLIEEATHIAKKNNFKIVELNVNRHNPALQFYEKMGFSILKEVDIPYHQFILSDYIMQKEV